MLADVFIFGAGVAVGWVVFEKPEMAKAAWVWVKAQAAKLKK